MITGLQGYTPFQAVSRAAAAISLGPPKEEDKRASLEQGPRQRANARCHGPCDVLSSDPLRRGPASICPASGSRRPAAALESGG